MRDSINVPELAFLKGIQNIRKAKVGEKLQHFKTSVRFNPNFDDDLVFSGYNDHMRIIGRSILYSKEDDCEDFYTMSGLEELTGKEITSFEDIDFKYRIVFGDNFLKTYKTHDLCGNPEMIIDSRLRVELIEGDERKTIKEWEKKYGVKILDPDGFNRHDPDLYKRKFTRERFEQGLLRSTIELQPESQIRR